MATSTLAWKIPWAEEPILLSLSSVVCQIKRQRPPKTNNKQPPTTPAIHTHTHTLKQTKAQGWISCLACQGAYAKEESFPACEAETLRISGCVFSILMTPQHIEEHFTS